MGEKRRYKGDYKSAMQNEEGRERMRQCGKREGGGWRTTERREEKGREGKDRAAQRERKGERK